MAQEGSERDNDSSSSDGGGGGLEVIRTRFGGIRCNAGGVRLALPKFQRNAVFGSPSQSSGDGDGDDGNYGGRCGHQHYVDELPVVQCCRCKGLISCCCKCWVPVPVTRCCPPCEQLKELPMVIVALVALLCVALLACVLYFVWELNWRAFQEGSFTYVLLAQLVIGLIFIAPYLSVLCWGKDDGDKRYPRYFGP